MKQLATFHGQPLALRAIDGARAAGADPIFVVLGAHADAVQLALRDTGVRVVVNDDWATGVASSLRAGIAAALDHENVDGVMILTIDQPLVDVATLRSLANALDHAHSIIASRYAGTIGVPIVVTREHLADLASSVAGDRGAGAWLRERGDAVTTIPVPAAEHDVDTVDALRALEKAVLTPA